MNYSKLAKYETMAHREGMLQRFKETSFWDYSESRGYHTYSPWGYFYDLLKKSVGKNAQEVFNKIKSNPHYKNNHFFKRECNLLIKACTNRVHLRTGYYDPWTNTDFYVDTQGLLQDITQHPNYKEMEEKLKVIHAKEKLFRKSQLMVRRVHEHWTPDVIVVVDGVYYFAKERTSLTKYEEYRLKHFTAGTVYCTDLSLLSEKDLEYFELK